MMNLDIGTRGVGDHPHSLSLSFSLRGVLLHESRARGNHRTRVGPSVTTMPRKKLPKNTPGGTINPKALKVSELRIELGKRNRDDWAESCSCRALGEMGRGAESDGSGGRDGSSRRR